MDTDCILWEKCKTDRGYGQVYFDGKMLYAHRVAYEKVHGPVPKGLYVMHRCDTPLCVNPDHLSVGTQKENLQDMVRKGRSNTGVKNPRSVLSEADVRTILVDSRPVRKIAEDYSVHFMTIQHIKQGRTWKHLQTTSN